MRRAVTDPDRRCPAWEDDALLRFLSLWHVVAHRMRVAIARALANRPILLLADEPTGQLDLETGHRIMSMLRSVVASEGITAIVATHDKAMMDVADRIIELRDGEIVTRIG